MKDDTLSRRDALKNIVILPALAAAVAAGVAAPAFAVLDRTRHHQP